MSGARSNEQVYFDALTRIAKCYLPASRVAKAYSPALAPQEALEMAYENIQSEAKAAIKGKKRPKAP